MTGAQDLEQDRGPGSGAGSGEGPGPRVRSRTGTQDPEQDPEKNQGPGSGAEPVSYGQLAADKYNQIFPGFPPALTKPAFYLNSTVAALYSVYGIYRSLCMNSDLQKNILFTAGSFPKEKVSVC